MRKEFLAVFSGFPEHHFSKEITERLRAELTERKSIVFITACPLDYEQMTTTATACTRCLRSRDCRLRSTA
ncbi:MAG: hypothetical protein J6U66_00705 [Lachnospiraceae bacterium]|nr:hypothetical protein [Lachnospiraceae bacterium]